MTRSCGRRCCSTRLPSSASGQTVRLRWRLGTSRHTANQGGTGFFQPQAFAIDDVDVVTDKADQTVSFTSSAPVNPTVGASYTPTATATSGLPVTFSIAATSTSVCSLGAGNLVTFNAAGPCAIRADQAGNAGFVPAPTATQSVTVVRANQTISFGSSAPVNQPVGATYTPSATATSGLGVVISIAPGSMCSLGAGNLVTFTAAGSCVIQADQAGNASYTPAPQVTQNVRINPVSRPAVVRSSTTWLFRTSLTTGEADLDPFTYGTKPMTPLVGDWDANGSRTPGSFENGVFKLNNANDSSAADVTFTFGDSRGHPVAGDFNGDGYDDVAVFRSGTWQVHYLGTTVPADATFSFGPALAWPSVVPVAGDWDGDGIDGIGIYNNGAWSLKNVASAGAADLSPTFAPGTDPYPVVGDWNGDGIDTVGGEVPHRHDVAAEQHQHSTHRHRHLRLWKGHDRPSLLTVLTRSASQAPRGCRALRYPGLATRVRR